MEGAISCGICKNSLGKEYVNIAADRKYHIECFLCSICNKKLAGGMFFEVDGKLYCEDDYYPRFAPTCARCDKLIKDEFVDIDGLNYHSTCFKCVDCQTPFKGLQYYKYNGAPYCTECYKKRASTCAKCNKEILGKIYSAMNKTFHLECFACSLCEKAFDEGNYIPFNDQGYHSECYKAKFTMFCFICTKEIWGEYLFIEGAGVHQECYPKFKELDGTEQRKRINQARTEAVSRVNKLVLSNSAQISTETKTKEEVPVRRTTVQATSKIVEGISTNEKAASPSGTVYEYEALVRPPYPKGMDPTKREHYLSYAEFEKIFKMTYEEFKVLKFWKQQELKKAVKLF